MIKDGYITKSETIEILQKFFEVNFSFDQLYLIYKSKRTKDQLQKFVKNKFKQILLEIQTNLFMAKCIDKVKLYDNKSQKLYDQLIKMDQYFNKQLTNDFLNEQRYKLHKLQKLSSFKRLRLYREFINQAERKNLFRFAIQTSEILPSQKRPYECPSKIYPSNQLQLINLLYELQSGDYYKIAEKLKDRGYTQIEYGPPLLYENLNNLELIGLFRCYRKSIISKGGKGMDWGEFVKDQSEFMEQIKLWDRNILVLLVRIAAQGIKQASDMQIRIICSKIGRRYNDKPILQDRITYTKTWQKMGLTSGKKNDSQEINKLRMELLAVLGNKIQFHPVNSL